MKKSILFLFVIGCYFVLLSGCAANKTTYERGWVGGTYLESNPSFLKKISANYFEGKGQVLPALPEEIKNRQPSCVLVSRVFTDTPLQQAGIREGDLILTANDQPMESPRSFHKIVDQSKPGDGIRLSIYRDGKIRNTPVVVGKETYQKWGYFHLGFRLSENIKLIPNPDFTILDLVSYRSNDTRLELHSPEYRYYREALSLPPDASDRTAESEADAEGWNLWLLIFGFEGKKIVLSQQSWD